MFDFHKKTEYEKVIGRIHCTFIYFPHEMFNAITALSQKYNITPTKAIQSLVEIALENNFTPDFKYIPCAPRSKQINFVITPGIKKEKSILSQLRFPKKQINQIRQFAQKNYLTLSASIRLLISTAFQYNFDEDLNYIKATQLSQSTEYSANSPLIVLDKI